VRIEIRKSQFSSPAVIITFHTRSDKFRSDYERTKFFKGLYGWKQVIPSRRKKYCYKRCGLLDEVPHIKIADSVLLIAMKHLEKIMDYFEQWENKVEFDVMEVMVKKELMKHIL